MDELGEGPVMSSKGLASNLLLLRLPYRGGNWTNTSNAGLAALNLNNPRTNSNTNIGFRPRFRSQTSQKLRTLWRRFQCLIERIPDPRHGETFSLTPEKP